LQVNAPVGRLLRRDPDYNRLAALGDAIFDRILDDRLQQQRRQARLLEVLGHVDLDMKAVGETRFLDVEIKTLEVDLLGQGDVCAWVERQARAEEGRKREQHARGAVGPP